MSRDMKSQPLPPPKRARESAGLTQEGLAHRTGCSLATVARCERAARYPRVLALRRAYLAALSIVDPEDDDAEPTTSSVRNVK